ncbi:MAG TPA: hypothetical protein VNX27_06125 [Chthoniobacterales bacterium]|nr:hypothetical protein [Chthoniobacterales bacterium]
MTRFLLALLVLPVASYAADSVHLSGHEAEAIQRATQIFISKQGSKYAGWPVYGALRHYTIELRRQASKLEIDFIPDQPPLKPNEAATGGGTKYGWEVVYVFSLSPLKLLEEHYTR